MKKDIPYGKLWFGLLSGFQKLIGMLIETVSYVVGGTLKFILGGPPKGMVGFWAVTWGIAAFVLAAIIFWWEHITNMLLYGEMDRSIKGIRAFVAPNGSTLGILILLGLGILTFVFFNIVTQWVPVKWGIKILNTLKLKGTLVVLVLLLFLLWMGMEFLQSQFGVFSFLNEVVLGNEPEYVLDSSVFVNAEEILQRPAGKRAVLSTVFDKTDTCLQDEWISPYLSNFYPEEDNMFASLKYMEDPEIGKVLHLGNYAAEGYYISLPCSPQALPLAIFESGEIWLVLGDPMTLSVQLSTGGNFPVEIGELSYVPPIPEVYVTPVAQGGYQSPTAMPLPTIVPRSNEGIPAIPLSEAIAVKVGETVACNTVAPIDLGNQGVYASDLPVWPGGCGAEKCWFVRPIPRPSGARLQLPFPCSPEPGKEEVVLAKGIFEGQSYELIGYASKEGIPYVRMEPYIR